MGRSTRVLAGSLLALGFAAALLLPNGHTCRDADAVEVHRQWSYSQERFSYGCWPSQEAIKSQGVFHPIGAYTDWRIPLRVAVLAAGLVLAWIVIANDRRSVLDDREQNSSRGVTVRRRLLVAVSSLGGATIAFLLTLQQDSYCIRHGRGPGSLSCSYRSFFGWAAEPILVEMLFTVFAAAAGAAVGVLIARWVRNERYLSPPAEVQSYG